MTLDGKVLLSFVDLDVTMETILSFRYVKGTVLLIEKRDSFISDYV